MKTIRFSIMMLLAGLLLGFAFHLWDPTAIKQWFNPSTEEPELSIPEGGVKTDEWSWKCFQKLAVQNPTGFVYSPLGLNIILRDIQALTDEATSKSIDAMHLPDINAAMDGKAPAYGFSQLVVDAGIPTKDHDHARGVLNLPLLSDRAEALDALHIKMVQSINNQFDYPILTSMVPRQAELMGFTLISQPTPWLHSFRQDAGDYISFDTYQSGTQMLDAIYTQAPIRMIQTAEYDAYALFLKGDAESSKWTCMLIIMPKLDLLSDFVKRLKVSDINAIKTALIQVDEPELVEFKMPAFQVIAQSMSMRPLMEALGLGSLFTKEANFTGLSEQKVQLEELWHSANIEIKAEESPLWKRRSDDESLPLFELNKPFIWMIGELTEGDCPSMMGCVETL